MAEPPSWPELIVLMAFGPTGAADECVSGTLATEQDTIRVSRRGDLVRIERPDGRLTAIFGADTTWLFGEHAEPEAWDRHRSAFGWAGADIVHRPPLSRWEGDDFTKLTGPIEPVEFLGRRAWAFELAPPRHKPYPLQMVVDAQTGLILRQANRDLGTVTEWTSLDVDANLPGELFEWTGPVRDAVAERDAEHEADMAARRAWLAARGVADLPIAAEPELRLNAWDDGSGAFHVSLDATVSGSLLRRPHGTEPWDEADDLRWETSYRWSDEHWDWCLAGTFTISGEQLELLKVRLATTT